LVFKTRSHFSFRPKHLTRRTCRVTTVARPCMITQFQYPPQTWLKKQSLDFVSCVTEFGSSLARGCYQREYFESENSSHAT